MARPPAGQARVPRGSLQLPAGRRLHTRPRTRSGWVKWDKCVPAGHVEGLQGQTAGQREGGAGRCSWGKRRSSRTKGRGQQPIACAKARVPKVVAPSLRLVMGPEGRGWVSGPPADACWPLGPGGPREPAVLGGDRSHITGQERGVKEARPHCHVPAWVPRPEGMAAVLWTGLRGGGSDPGEGEAAGLQRRQVSLPPPRQLPLFPKRPPLP